MGSTQALSGRSLARRKTLDFLVNLIITSSRGTRLSFTVRGMSSHGLATPRGSDNRIDPRLYGQHSVLVYRAEQREKK